MGEGGGDDDHGVVGGQGQLYFYRTFSSFSMAFSILCIKATMDHSTTRNEDVNLRYYLLGASMVPNMINKGSKGCCCLNGRLGVF